MISERHREKVCNLLKKLHLYDFIITYETMVIYMLTGKKIFEVDVKSYWSERSKTEDYCSEPNDYDPYYAKYNACIISEIQPLPEVKTILDVGCFIGNRLSVIHTAMPEKRITGCDLGVDQLLICRQRFSCQEGVDLIQCSAANLPFKDNTFDLVFSSAVLMCIPDTLIEKILIEMNRVGKKHLFLVETYVKHIPFLRKLQLLSAKYLYAHDYEKLLLKARFNKVKVYGIPDENKIDRYSVFLYTKR